MQPMTSGFEDLSRSELLDQAELLGTAKRETEVAMLRLAVQFAILNSEDTLDPEVSKLPGRERARQYGGIGTPRAAEFCCAELGARLGITSAAAYYLIADGLDLLLRLPQLWKRVEALEVQAHFARHVASRTRDLTVEQAAYVDARVVESADGRIPFTRFKDLVQAAVDASDPEAAQAREEAEATRQFARATRSTESGMRGFYVRGSFHIIALLDARVAYFAQVLADLGDTDDLDARRVKAIALMASPHLAAELMSQYAAWKGRPAAPPGPQAPEIDWAAMLPTINLFVHVYAGVVGEAEDLDSPGVARIEGAGALTLAWLAQHFGPSAPHAPTLHVKSVIDLAGQAPVDAYEIPDRHRQAVHLMTPADIFPFSPSTSRDKQVDHTRAFQHGEEAKGAGQSRIGNYGPMTGFHHRIKTHGHGWECQQPFPGIYVWRDPGGRFYLVDHTGTRRFGAPAASSPQEQRLELAWSDLVLTA